MNQAAIIKQLREIEVWAEGTRQRAAKTRKSLEGLNPSAPRKGKKKEPFTPEEMAAILAKRHRRMFKNQNK